MNQLRFALDQNFPPIFDSALRVMPEVEITPILRIDSRMPALGDRELVIALYQLGWTGLITNNYRMLYQPQEIAAIHKTRITVFAVEGVGDDPVRATGAVLLDLPGALKKVVHGKSQIFFSRPRNPSPTGAWDYFMKAANRNNREPESLYKEVKVTRSELTTPVLPPLADH